MANLLDPDTVTTNLAKLSGWILSTDQKAVEKCYTFDTFPAAFAFMTHVAFWAEQHNHHPDWRNVYNRVEVRLSTHDCGGLTQLDFDLAQAMDNVDR